MKKILLDYISPVGHISLINFYLKNIGKDFDCIFLNKKIKDNIVKSKNLKFLEISNLSILKIINLYILFSKFKKNKISKIIMLSYEPKILFFLSFFLDLGSFKIYLVEHDNLNEKKLLNIFFIRCLSKNFKHLTYSLPAKKFLKKDLNKKVILINHPIIKKDESSKLSVLKNKCVNKMILIPTRHDFNENSIKDILKRYKDINFIILLKKSNLLKKKFFEFKNAFIFEKIFEKDIEKISAIYLPIKESYYKYRVSAWLYRGIAFKKKIILDNNELYKFEKKRFPNYVQNKRKNFHKILNIKIDSRNNKSLTQNYNFKLIREFKNILFE